MSPELIHYKAQLRVSHFVTACFEYCRCRGSQVLSEIMPDLIFCVSQQAAAERVEAQVTDAGAVTEYGSPVETGYSGNENEAEPAAVFLDR